MCCKISVAQDQEQGNALQYCKSPCLGVSASVHSGNLVCGGNSQSVQSKQGVSPGMIMRACPLRPSVPPSTMTLKLAGSGAPSSSYSELCNSFQDESSVVPQDKQ